MLKDLFSQLFAAPEENIDAEQQASLAAAVLLVEIGKADLHLQPSELAVIQGALVEHFSLPAEQVHALIDQAQHERDASVSMQPYVDALNKSTDRLARIKLLQALWQVAFADGHLDAYEEQLMRRIADLLYLSHSDYIQTKLSVTGEH
ncbi:MAG: TerB family tellurite resistance protein [Oceanococcus sp.]